MGDWRQQAACVGMDFELFWAAGRGYTPIEGIRVCLGCPVRLECLHYALTQTAEDDAGVWGGTTERSRRDVREGRMTLAEALERGEQAAEQRTHIEQVAEDEPWLLYVVPDDHRRQHERPRDA